MNKNGDPGWNGARKCCDLRRLGLLSLVALPLSSSVMGPTSNLSGKGPGVTKQVSPMKNPTFSVLPMLTPSWDLMAVWMS